MSDEVVKEVAVEVERGRLQRNEAVDPVADPTFRAFAEADVRVPDDVDQRSSSSRTRSKTAYSSAPRRQNTARWRERARLRKSIVAESMILAQRSVEKPSVPAPRAGSPTEAMASSSARSSAETVAVRNFASASGSSGRDTFTWITNRQRRLPPVVTTARPSLSSDGASSG